MADHRSDQFAGQFGRGGIPFRLGEMAVEDRFRGALPEVGFEDRGKRQPTSRRTTSVSAARGATDPSASALPVSLRRHPR